MNGQEEKLFNLITGQLEDVQREIDFLEGVKSELLEDLEELSEEGLTE